MKLGINGRTFICIHRKGFYFRVMGRGASVDADMPVLFSERHGFRKVWRIGRFSFEVLR